MLTNLDLKKKIFSLKVGFLKNTFCWNIRQRRSFENCYKKTSKTWSYKNIFPRTSNKGRFFKIIIYGKIQQMWIYKNMLLRTLKQHEALKIIFSNNQQTWIFGCIFLEEPTNMDF